jgi:Spy/CpxP family protein refolding chaperone
MTVLGLGIVLGGCDAVSNLAEEETMLTGEMALYENALVTLSTEASLSSSETSTLRDLIASYDDEIDEPGALWPLAADIHEELSREQIERLKAQLQERRERMQERGRFGPPGNPGPRFRDFRPRWVQKLDLTTEQEEELRAIRAEYRDSLNVLREKCRAGTVDESDAERWQALHAEMREAMRAVLTDEQRAQLEALLDEKKARLEAIQEARAEALELTDEQREQFDSLRTPFGEPGERFLTRCTREDGEERPFASILTEEQREIVMIHHLLLRSKMQEEEDPRGPRQGPPGF